MWTWIPSQIVMYFFSITQKEIFYRNFTFCFFLDLRVREAWVVIDFVNVFVQRLPCNRAEIPLHIFIDIPVMNCKLNYVLIRFTQTNINNLWNKQKHAGFRMWSALSAVNLFHIWYYNNSSCMAHDTLVFPFYKNKDKHVYIIYLNIHLL